MKSIIKYLFIFLSTLVFSQTNLIDASSWTEGASSATGFAYRGDESENTIEYGTGPHGDDVLLWKSAPNDNNTSGGGWYTDYVAIDHTKTYRFTVWAKKTYSHEGRILFAFLSNYVSSTTTSNTIHGVDVHDPWFAVTSLPTQGDWYLLVGYVHGSTYNGTVDLGGIYDPNTGNKLSSTNDYMFKPNASSMRQEVYVAQNASSADTQFFYEPTFYEVNGLEPTIEELLQPQSSETDNPSTGISENYWNLNENNQGIYYNLGNVGIGTSIPDSQLTVKGTIHSEEVKVDLSVPAPDYVFESNYNLKSLEKLEEYISAHGHLPNIPSAREMETNGVELGLMNVKLLEKIEELTLYILEQEKRLKKIESINKLKTN